MKDAMTETLGVLRERGYRVTKARERVVAVLASQDQPSTIQALARVVAADEASVYRTIETLRAEGLIEEIALPGEKPKFSLQHGHHHHIVCTDCGIVVHIPCHGIAVPLKVNAHFADIERHEVTYYGRCKACA